MPLRQDAPFETPRQLVAESSAPLPVVIFPDGSTEPAPAGSVLAEDIIGQLTNEQIEEIEAAKVSGKLTAEQIASIEAAQVTGQLVDAQIKEIGVGKLKGFIEGSQIAAETITGGNIAALTITGAKIVAGTILGEKIAAATITGANIAAETITGTKIAGETITGAKIAAGTITAGKLSVSELSAITANLGTITAGKLKAVIIEAGTGSFEGELTATALTFAMAEIVNPQNTIKWKFGGNTHAYISGERLGAENLDRITIAANLNTPRDSIGQINLQAVREDGAQSSLILYSGAIERSVGVTAGGETLRLARNGKESDFLQLPETAKRVINRGTSEAEFPGASTRSKIVTVTHGLGSAPTHVTITPIRTEAPVTVMVGDLIEGSLTATTFKMALYSSAEQPAGTKVKFTWDAMT